MFSFWIIAGLLLLLPILVIMITLLKTHDNDNADIERNSELYQQRLNELESDIENGLLSISDAENVKEEIQVAILNQTKTEQPSLNKTDSSTSTITTALLLILIPAFVIGLYQHLGQPNIIAQAELLSDFNNAENTEQKLASVEKMLTQLEQRLINEPDDIDGWLMLTNSYTALERYPEALKAVDNLYRLRGDDPTVMLRYADILSMVNGGLLAGKPTELINEALKIDPENPTGLWLAGLAANEQGNIEDAVKYWQQLLPKLEDGSEPQQQIKKYIQMALQHTDSANTIDIESAPKDTSTLNIALNIDVSLSENLMPEVNKDDTVFIYAKALSGPPMPIAIIRKNVSDLPLQAILDDSQAMIPSNKLSDHEQVQLTARISKSGNAMPQTGDLIGTLENVDTDHTDPIKLVIDKKIQ
jgi:cytochrome c-type biogenesis protein CcmH